MKIPKIHKGAQILYSHSQRGLQIQEGVLNLGGKWKTTGNHACREGTLEKQARFSNAEELEQTSAVYRCKAGRGGAGGQINNDLEFLGDAETKTEADVGQHKESGMLRKLRNEEQAR